MKIVKVISMALVATAALASCTKEVTVSVIPTPVSMEAAGNGVSISDKAPVFTCENEELQTLGQTFLEIANGVNLPDFTLSIDPALENEEYVLNSKKGSVKISGGSKAGVWWGLQTALQIISQSTDKFPGLIIKDKPAFAYRGAHFDVCRHFFTIDEVKRFIDMVNLHKVNVLHWHLTEDQGWRIEIKQFPKLTEVGSVRKETVVGHQGSNQGYDKTPHGGFYTQEEMKEIVAYAAARQMVVIPELEIPGHASAALAAYPEYGCTGKGYEVQPNFGIFEEIFCAGNPKTLDFIYKVLDEMCEIFPSEYIHIGGDESPRAAWEKCPKCQALMKEMGYTSEAQLQSYLINNAEKHLNEKGRKIIGWDEILEGGVTQTATVMSWRGTEGGITAAKMGNPVIMSPTTYFYLDYYQTQDPEANGEPLAIGGYLPLAKCYEFDPFEGLNEEEQKNIKGIQANLWTEYIPTFTHVEHMELPRIVALAEIAWSNTNRVDYGTFVADINKALVPIWQSRNYNYSTYDIEK